MKSATLRAVRGVLGPSACARQPHEVRIPVAVPCVDARYIPPEVPPTGTPPEDARAPADVLAIKVLELRGTDRELRALLSGCTR